MKNIKGLLKPVNRYRRYMLIASNPDYVKNQLAKRKGKCLKCGKCCEGCEFLDKKTNLCKIYKDRPKTCKDKSWFCFKEFPLDKIDQKIWGVEKTCGYRFD